MIRRFAPLALLTLAVLLALVGAAGQPRPCGRHGNPVVDVTPKPVAVGNAIAIEGKGFEESDQVSLTLEGPSGEIALGTAVADVRGNFREQMTLPASVAAGSYRLRARGRDVTAIVDFTVVAAPGEPQTAAGHEGSVRFHRLGPSAEIVALGAALAVIALAGLIVLVWPERVPGSVEGRTRG